MWEIYDRGLNTVAVILAVWLAWKDRNKPNE